MTKTKAQMTQKFERMYRRFYQYQGDEQIIPFPTMGREGAKEKAPALKEVK